MKHGIAETLLLIGVLLLVIGSLMLIGNSYVGDTAPAGITTGARTDTLWFWSADVS